MIEAFIPPLTFIVAICFSELAIHKYQIRRLALKDNDKETAEGVTNDALMAAGIVGAASWLLLAVTVGDSSSEWVEIGLLVLLALGVVGAVWLYIRMRF